MKRKIFLYYVILTIVGISITGFFTSNLTQKFYKNEVRDKLKTAAILIQNDIIQELSEGTHVDYNIMAGKYSKVLNRFFSEIEASMRRTFRMTFISYDGAILGESDTTYTEMENHADRNEFQEAIKNGIGDDIRLSSTLNINYLYVAVPLESAQVVIRVAVPLVHLQNIDRIFWTYTLIGIIAGIILTILLALRFSSYVTYPVNELIAFSKEIARGNYSKRIVYSSKNEIGQLSKTFNEMAERLDKTMSEIMDKNVKLDSVLNSMTNGVVAVDDNYKVILINSIACEMFNIRNDKYILGTNIIELIRNSQINELLKDTIKNNSSLVNEINLGMPDDRVLRVYTTPIKSKNSTDCNSGGIISIHDITSIRKLEQIRTDFVSNVTHELKTPLTSIRGFIETLRSGAINDGAVADKFLEIIDIEAERLYMLINDILQLSEIENRHMDVNIDIYNLNSIVGEIFPLLQELADKKGVNLSAQIDQDINIAVNRDRIKQMLINLAENAIKYNSKNGSVTISARKEAGSVVIKVKDTGIGIPKEHIERIFERFYRVDKGRSRNMGGTGLGLSIVKHIVNLYSGVINVNSEPGKGSEFTINLPV